MDKEREAGELTADLERARGDVAQLQASTRVQANDLKRAREDGDALRRQVGDLQADLAAAPAEGPRGAGVDLDDLRRKTGVDDIRNDEQGNLVITLESGITFGSGSANLTSGGQSTLDRVARTVREEFPGRLIRVEGHTDTDPIKRTRSKFADNWDLGFNRARSVAVYFRDKGSISPEQLVLASRGEYDPVESNKNEQGKRRNRRVEIIVELPRGANVARSGG